jgi:TRAP-type C4-dicarboxylate transport system permease small subunit
MNALFRGVRKFFEAVAALLFAAIVVVFASNIVARFAFNRPILWADEVLIYLMIWCTFLSIAFVVREREHVAFDLVYEQFSPGGRRVLLIVGALLTAAIFAAASPAMLDYIRFLWRERTSILDVRLDIAYSVFGVFIVMLIASRLLMAFRLMGRDWTTTLDDIEGRDKASHSAPSEPRS